MPIHSASISLGLFHVTVLRVRTRIFVTCTHTRCCRLVSNLETCFENRLRLSENVSAVNCVSHVIEYELVLSDGRFITINRITVVISYAKWFIHWLKSKPIEWYSMMLYIELVNFFAFIGIFSIIWKWTDFFRFWQYKISRFQLDFRPFSMECGISLHFLIALHQRIVLLNRCRCTIDPERSMSGSLPTSHAIKTLKFKMTTFYTMGYHIRTKYTQFWHTPFTIESAQTKQTQTHSLNSYL